MCWAIPAKKPPTWRSTATALLANIERFNPDLGPIDRTKVQADRWQECAFLFQLTDDEIPSLAKAQATLTGQEVMAKGRIESFVFLAIELTGERWSRTELANIMRELNRRFPMPAIVLFRHGGLLSLALVSRRAAQA